MAKRANSIVGIDLGKHAFKGVLMQRKGESRFVLSGYAMRDVPENFETADELADQLKLLLKDIGSSAKCCAVAISDPAALLRIIEQPETPINLLRDALRLNGLAVLNQETRDFVLDCASVLDQVVQTPEMPIPSETGSDLSSDGGTQTQVETQVQTPVMVRNGKAKYLVGGMLRSTVRMISEAVSKTKMSPEIIQLAPICSFNAFEFAYPNVCASESFLLLEMGHLQSTIMIGRKRELVLVRSIDYGGKALDEALTGEGTLAVDVAHRMLKEGDPGMIQICRESLALLADEVRNSIGFFEGQREEGIHRIFVSGGLASLPTVLQPLSDDLSLPCEIWDPLESCEVALPAAKRETLPDDFVSLNVACGAALEYLRG